MRSSITPKPGGFFTLTCRLLLVLTLWLPLPLALWAIATLLSLAHEVPQLPDLASLNPPWPTRIETLHGTRLAGAKAQAPVPLVSLPPMVVGALLASEDEDFFSHSAFNLRSIARAALQNLQAHRPAQGGSTLTQQLAKQFMGREKSYQRKVKELLLARRLEATHSKHHLLATYLHTAFWGHTNHGITQAAWFYFDRDPRELSLGQIATLIGMLPAPNAYDPIRHLPLALVRRDHVLSRMLATGMLSPAQVSAAKAAPLHVRTLPPPPPPLPSAVATGMRLVGQMGDHAWSQGALQVVVPHDWIAQIDAANALLQAAEAYDRRQGWQGGFGAVWPERQEELLRRIGAAHPSQSAFALGLIEDVGHTQMSVRLGSGQLVPVDLDTLRWASDASLPRHYKRPLALARLSDTFSPGQLVVAHHLPQRDLWTLIQPPQMEGAFFAQEVPSGNLLASVGSVHPDTSQFQRAEQGCRQPGSVFKPFVYAEALRAGLTAATMLADVPQAFVSEHGEIWQPRNADRNFKGYMTMTRALAGSRNIPTVHLAERLGARRIKARAQRLGLTTPMRPVPSLALGASCLKPYELVAAYSALGRQGRVIRPALIDHIRWQDQRIQDEGSWSAPHLSLSHRLWRLARPAERMPRGIRPSLAYILTWMLRQVVVAGTAHLLPKSWPVVGKTGTTNAYDTWFIGMDPTLAAGIWIGSDLNRHPVGPGEHGATVAMPAFANFYAPRAALAPPLDWDTPPKGVEVVPIDPATGLRAAPGEPGVNYPFVLGSAPAEFAPTVGTRQSEQVDELMHQF